MRQNAHAGNLPVPVIPLVMTLLMCIAVVPLGVLAALYLREYAKFGPAISAVRIASHSRSYQLSAVSGELQCKIRECLRRLFLR